MWASGTFAYLGTEMPVNALHSSSLAALAVMNGGALADVRGSPVDRLRNAPLVEPFRHIRLPVRVGSSGASITGRTIGIPV